MALQFGIDQQSPKFDAQGMLIPGTGGLPAVPGASTPTSNYASVSQFAPQAQQSTSQNPLDIFNTNLMTLLRKSQAVNTAPLANEQNRLGIQQINNSMAPASQIQGGAGPLRPGDALNARQDAGQLYNPEINNLTQRMQASATAVANFKDALNAAKDYGVEMMKNVKPDDATIKGVQDMLIAGENPGQDVLNSAAKYIDWTAVAAGKKAAGSSDQPASYKEYALTTDKPTSAGYAQFLKTGTKSGDGTPDDFSAKETAAVKRIIDSKPGDGGWGATADAIDRILGVGTANKYDNILKTQFRIPADARDFASKVGGVIRTPSKYQAALNQFVQDHPEDPEEAAKQFKANVKLD